MRSVPFWDIMQHCVVSEVFTDVAGQYVGPSSSVKRVQGGKKASTVAQILTGKVCAGGGGVISKLDDSQ
jgi:hypothetical protein